MEKVVVYRLDRENGLKIPVGKIRERRKKERGGNAIGLLRLAMMTYPSCREAQLQYHVR